MCEKVMIKVDAIKSCCDFFKVKSFLQVKPEWFKKPEIKELKYASEKIDSLYRNLEKLDKISKSNPELYKLICKNYKSGNIDENAFNTFVDFIEDPIGDYRTLKAIKHYKNEGYKFTNIFLRTGKFKAYEPNGAEIRVSDDYKVLIKRESKIISDYIKGRSFSYPLTLYRGDDYIALKNTVISDGKFKGKSLAEVLQEAERLPEIEKKLIIEELISQNEVLYISYKSFLSTSFTKEGAKNTKPLFFKFTTQGKINGICPDIEPTHHVRELEFLVQKKSKAYINKIDYNNKNQWQFDAYLQTD